MKNPGTAPRGLLNEFTLKIKDADSASRPIVRMRNGDMVIPVYREAEDEHCEPAFYTEDYRYCWQLDGVSVTRSDYDMMEFVR